MPWTSTCRVLEIGCGDGRLTRRYASRVARVLAIDPDESLVRAFRDGGVDSNVEVRATSFDRLDLPEQSMDAAVFAWSL
jgi:16S rRNA A1518/A1519 N6-dimethyltransferase RsmA/KsgA/DIM1 with predicted DNA glycosylase/AP lyase activity